jgi:hypothetical protein
MKRKAAALAAALMKTSLFLGSDKVYQRRR